MKILCLSDTLGRLSFKTSLPQADVVIFAGDCCHMGNLEQIQPFLDWFRLLPVAHNIMVAGNHDFVFDHSTLFRGKRSRLFEFSGNSLPGGRVHMIDGIPFYGSP